MTWHFFFFFFLITKIVNEVELAIPHKMVVGKAKSSMDVEVPLHYNIYLSKSVPYNMEWFFVLIQFMYFYNGLI